MTSTLSVGSLVVIWQSYLSEGPQLGYWWFHFGILRSYECTYFFTDVRPSLRWLYYLFICVVPFPLSLKTSWSWGLFPLANHQALHKLWCSSVVQVYLSFWQTWKLTYTSSLAGNLPSNDCFCRWEKHSHKHIWVAFICASDHVSLASFVYAQKIMVGYFWDLVDLKRFSSRDLTYASVLLT